MGSVSLFPVKIATGASVKVKAQFTLSEKILGGATVILDIQRKEPWWLPNIHVPCIEVEGIKVGSCEYPVSWLLERGARYLCPKYSSGTGLQAATSSRSLWRVKSFETGSNSIR